MEWSTVGLEDVIIQLVGKVHTVSRVNIVYTYKFVSSGGLSEILKFNQLEVQFTMEAHFLAPSKSRCLKLVCL